MFNNNELLSSIIQLIIMVLGFVAGRYILPKHKDAVSSAISKFQMILNYAESFCAFAEQFIDDSGSNKMNLVVNKLDSICKENNIEVDEELLKAIAQRAYNMMINEKNNSNNDGV